jgi:hypothetical protein
MSSSLASTITEFLEFNSLRNAQNETFDCAQCASQTQPLTRANVIGMFLTLQFVLLTQPCGSLLFRGISGFFWRMNPIAALVEALLILYLLLKSVWDHRSSKRRSPWSPREHLKRHKLQIVAASLLLLRAAPADDKDDEEAEFFKELRRGTFLENGRSGAAAALTRVSEDGESTGQDNDFDNERESGNNLTGTAANEIELQNIHSQTLGSSLQATSQRFALSFNGNAQSSTSATEDPVQNVVRRSTSQLEAQLPRSPSDSAWRDNEGEDSDSGGPVNSRRTHLLDRAFGSNALAHKEFLIDLVTAVSVVTIVLKVLFGISGAGSFQIACFSQCFSWFIVQLLLMIFHCREISEEDKELAARLVPEIDKQLSGGVLLAARWLYLALHLPFLGYAVYFAIKRPIPIEYSSSASFLNLPAFIAIQFLVAAGIFGILIIVLLGSLLAIQAIFSTLEDQRSTVRDFRNFCILFPIYVVIGSCLSLGWAVHSPSPSLHLPTPLNMCPWLSQVSTIAPRKPIPTGAVVDWKYILTTTYRAEEALGQRVLQVVTLIGFVLYNLGYLIIGLVPLILLFVYLCLPDAMSESETPSKASAGKIWSLINAWKVSIGNVVFTVVVFGLFAGFYDSTETQKFGWTEYLG